MREAESKETKDEGDLPESEASWSVYEMLLLVFLPQDTLREVAVQEMREREGGRGGGGRVVASRGEDSGPRPTPFSACTLTLTRENIVHIKQQR